MHQKIEKMKRMVIAVLAFEAALLFFFREGLQKGILTATLILILQGVLCYVLIDLFENSTEEQLSGVRKVLGTAAEEAYLKGGIGLVIYDDAYEVTWMSELFNRRGIDRIGHKILTWVPEADDLIAGKADTAKVVLDDRVYEITRKEDAPVLFFRDVTELDGYRTKYGNEKFVLGMATFDNLEETTQYEDDADAAAIVANVRAPLTEYCSTHGVLARRIGNARYLLLLNEKTFNDLYNDHFSILSKVRKASQKMDVTVTLSMAFARGTSNYDELDDMVTNLMDLAETRGGDQVAVQTVGEDVKYFGGSTEATEKRSRVRVRVMSHALRDLMNKSSNIIICGHKMADFDCISSAICLSEMAAALKKPSCIIAKTGGIEEKMDAALKANWNELKQRVNFVTEGEALNQLTDKTLVIMTDHHNIRQSNGAKVLDAADRIVVIDHHRRSADMGVKPMLVYIEAGASSTCELLTEMIPYISNRTDINELEATFMLTGMLVDTQRWKVRTSARTFEAASALRELGADPNKAYASLKDTFDEFAIKSEVANRAERYRDGIVIACVEDRVLTRSLMSQVADSLLNVQGVEAAFVIANDSEVECGISARSAGRINVQMIMENMGGGGHMTAAAVQRDKGRVLELKEDLLQSIDTYLEEETNDESDS